MNRILSIGLALLLLAACVREPEIIHLQDVPDGFDRQYSNLLVVSVASDVGQRRRLEELIANELAMAGVDGTASYTHTGLHPTILQDAISEAASAAGAEGVLMTHIANVEHKIELEGGRTEVLSECRGGDPANLFLYDRYEIKEPDDVSVAHTVVVITNLYDMASDTRIWTIQSTCFDKHTMDEVLQEEAVAIVRQLKLDRLIP